MIIINYTVAQYRHVLYIHACLHCLEIYMYTAILKHSAQVCRQLNFALTTQHWIHNSKMYSSMHPGKHTVAQKGHSISHLV